MWISSTHVTEIKFIIDSSLTLKYCVHVHNTFIFGGTHYFIRNSIQNSSIVTPK